MKLHLRKLPVELVTKWANDKMLKDVALEKLEKHGVKLPVSQKTVWKWMAKAGGVNGARQKHHHNDKVLPPPSSPSPL
jgi:hypothetical protein